MTDAKDIVLDEHSEHIGVLSIQPELEVANRQDLGRAYTPGVAKIAKLIEADPAQAKKYTISGKLVALVTDGSAVLGLGDIGPRSGLPIVEGKALLYKNLAQVDAIPLAVDQVSVAEFVQTIKNISGSFAGIHLEDIAAPKCFEIEDELAKVLDIPVYHDDQEGTAIVVLAGLINAAKVVNKPLKSLRVVINGVGAGGYATAKLLASIGMTNLILVDQHGVVTASDMQYNAYQRQMAAQLNNQEYAENTPLAEAIKHADAFVGLSVGGVLTTEMVQTMANNPIVFALANPVPEITPQAAEKAGVAVMATGSSQFSNQVNNILVFPGLFRGLLETHLSRLTLPLEARVAEGLAELVKIPAAEKVIPGVFDSGVAEMVTQAVIDFSGQQK